MSRNDLATTVCELDGRLIDVSPRSEHTSRQSLSARGVQLYPHVRLPVDGSDRRSARSEDAAIASHSSSVRGLWSTASAWLSLPPRLLLPARHAFANAAEGTGCAITHYATHARRPLIAICSADRRLHLYDVAKSAFTTAATGAGRKAPEPPIVAGKAEIVDWCWNIDDLLAVTTQAGVSLYRLSGAGSTLELLAADLSPLPRAIGMTPGFRAAQWVGERYLLVCGDRGTWLLDALLRSWTQIGHTPSRMVCVSPSFIAVLTTRGWEVCSYTWPMQVYAWALLPLADASPVRAAVFATDRVLLFAWGDCVRTLQISPSPRAPTLRSLQRLSIAGAARSSANAADGSETASVTVGSSTAASSTVGGHDGEDTATDSATVTPRSATFGGDLCHLAVSGDRVLVSDGVWTGLAVLSTDVNDALWQVVGEIKAPAFAAQSGDRRDNSGTGHGAGAGAGEGRCRLVGATTITIERDATDVSNDLCGDSKGRSEHTKAGFALLWSSSAMTIFPIA